MAIRFHLGYSSRAVANYSVERRLDLVRMAEELGFHQLWHSNERFYRDCFVNMTASAFHTRDLLLGSAVADPYAVHPALTALAIATVDEYSGGRCTLGLGAGQSGFPAMGIQRRKPTRALREAIQLIRAFLRGEKVTMDGEVIHFRGGQLHFQPRQDIPIVVATRGDRVLEMGGEVADGVMIATYARPEGVRHALDRVAAGAARSGRSRKDIQIISRVDTCVLPDRALAREAVKPMIGFLLWASYPDQGFVERSGLKVPGDLLDVIAKRDYDLMFHAAHLVPDEFVDAFTWAGNVDDVATQVAEIAAIGLEDFGFWIQVPKGHDIEPIIRAIATDVRPRVERLVAARAGG